MPLLLWIVFLLSRAQRVPRSDNLELYHRTQDIRISRQVKLHFVKEMNIEVGEIQGSPLRFEEN